MPSPTSQELVAEALLQAGAVTISPDAPVTFKSGIRSPVYVDNRRLVFHPGPWHVVTEAFAERVSADARRVDVVAGVETAGIPHSSALAYATGLPSVFVRKEAKGHGLGRRIEGGDVRGQQVVLIEDMVTTGGSSLSAVGALRDAGASVDTCLSIITYGFTEATDAFAAANVELDVLTTFEAVLAAGQANGVIEPDAAASVGAWLAEPHTWSGA